MHFWQIHFFPVILMGKTQFIKLIICNILCRPGEYNLSFPVLSVKINASGHVELPENGTVMLSFGIPKVYISTC